jgi:glycosyltransferase involved in cell wall biosynthesis
MEPSELDMALGVRMRFGKEAAADDQLSYSVLCAAHRADSHLIEAIRSTVVAMNGHRAELVVVANGPARTEVARLAYEEGSGAAIKVVTSEIQSLIYCLNKGLEVARGEYIARMDADDLCVADRFSRQVEIAKSHSADIVVSDATVIRSDGSDAGDYLRASSSVWKKCGPIHPAVMMRRSVLVGLGGYGNLEFSEDYHLWLRMRGLNLRMVVDNNPAIRYRRHDLQATSRDRVIHTYATNIGIKITLGLRLRKLSYLAGSLYDAACYIYNVCRRVF